MSWRRKQKLLIAFLLFGSIISNGLNLKADAASPRLTSKIEMAAPVEFRDNQSKVYNMDFDDISIRKLIRMLAHQANINVMLDQTVEGNVSVTFNDLTLKEAFEYLRNIAGLYYVNKGDNIMLVTTKADAQEKGLNKSISKLIPIKYVNARLVTSLLNNTVFVSPAGAEEGGDTAKKATAEFRTNSIILVGTENDIRLAEDVINKIDIPRESRTFRINHAGAVEVAQLLQATVFNDGISPFNPAGGGEEDGIPSTPSGISVDIETFQEGSGSASEVSGASGESGGGEQQTFTLRAKRLETKDIKIAPDGPIIVPDSRTNTLTILGTVEQIALAESLIPTLDQKLPQVAIETSLVEIFEKGLRQLQPTIGTGDGQFAYGFNNRAVTQSTDVPPAAGAPAIPYNQVIEKQFPDGSTKVYQTGLLNNVLGLPTLKDKGQEGNEFAWTTKPLENSSQVLAQINAMVANRKAKLLANPTIIATHNTEAVISITEEIIRSTQITRDATGFTQTQVEIGEAGIILNILPKVGGDGFVTMRIRPSVSTVANQIEDQQKNLISLLNRRDLAVQEVRIANGQTLALGGLIQERDVSEYAKVPGLGDIPIIGTLFRTSYKDLSRSELIILVTPSIMEDAYPLSPASRISSLMNNPEVQAMMAGNTAKNR